MDVENNGHFIKNIDSSSSGATTIKVLAPIFLENTKCSINWQDSTYLKNSKPWQTVGKPDYGITVSNADGKSKGIDLKVSWCGLRSYIDPTNLVLLAHQFAKYSLRNFSFVSFSPKLTFSIVSMFQCCLCKICLVP